MAEAIVSVVLETLKVLLVEEANLSGASDHVVELQEELERIKSFLKDADSKQHDGDLVRTCIRQIRRLAYKAQDVLEKYTIQVKSKRGSRIKELLRRFSCIVNEWVSLHQVGKEIRNLNSRLAGVRESLHTYGINSSNEEERAKAEQEKQRFLRKTFAHIGDADFVGMENEMDKFLSLVVEEGNFNVISIHGMGGSGKTTMARKIYNHSLTKQHFDAFSWVCITQKCDVKTILRDLLKQLNVQSSDDYYDEPVREISKVMEDKKCLVVIDDIWKIEDWRLLQSAFANANGKSKILLTTRIEQVANVGLLCRQRLLNEEESLKLFVNKVCNQNNHQDPHIEELVRKFGKEIVGKCKGLPLAIATLGGILASKVSIAEWEKINRDIGPSLNHGSSNIDDFGAASNVLALSYHDLPHFLKPCFLYMASFKEDEVINPRMLYHLWISEGLVSPELRLQDETLMDVAERFLKELNSRCLVELEIDPMLGRLMSCTLHDLIRDLCLRKARQEDFMENIFMDFRGGQDAEIDASVVGNAHRLTISFDISMLDSRCVKPFDQLESQFLRALSFMGNKYVRSSNYSVEVSPEKLKLARVLKFNYCRFRGRKLPNGISKLVHLHYLSLSGSVLEKLPSSVANFPLLQTLDLRMSHFIQIPHNIFSKKKLSLRHLYLEEFICEPRVEKLQLDGLSELETLVVGSLIGEVELTHLSKLVKIRYSKVGSPVIPVDWPLIIDQMESWERIQQLKIEILHAQGEDVHKSLMSHSVTDMILYCQDFEYSGLPNEIPLCHNLVNLEIHSLNTTVISRVMVLVGKIPNLLRLCCSGIDIGMNEIHFHGGDFPRLKFLELSNMNVQKLMVGMGSLPRLITLKLAKCDKLEIVPEDGLRYLHNLQVAEFGEGMEVLADKCWEHYSDYFHVIIKDI